MNYLRTDQYAHVVRDCPMSVDLHPADDMVEIAFGESRVGDVVLRLQIDHPDTCDRIMASVADARERLANHRSTNPTAGPTPSQSDCDLTPPALSYP